MGYRNGAVRGGLMSEEIKSLGDVWRKWSRRFVNFWLPRLGLAAALIAYQVHKSGREWNWW